MKITILSTRNCGKKHVSYTTILGLEDEFIENGCFILKCKPFSYFMNRIFRNINVNLNMKTINKSMLDECEGYFFYSAMVLEDILDMRATLKQVNERLILYVFDCWEPKWMEFQAILKEINPKAICFAYDKAVKHFSQWFENCWLMPQSMNLKYYHEYNLSKRRLFMQMGRKTECIHEMIINYLVKNKVPINDLNYVYEKQKGTVIFPDTATLAKEIASSYFFVCVPQNIENSKLTGNISEVTARYYEAMACKTMIIGIKPTDSFDKLFPYSNAMCEVNGETFEKTVTYYLENEDEYNIITARNYDYVMKNHRWKNRLKDLEKRLQSV